MFYCFFNFYLSPVKSVFVLLCLLTALHDNCSADFFHSVQMIKAGDSRTRNWYQKLSRQFGTGFSGTSFWYGIEYSSIPSQKLCDT